MAKKKTKIKWALIAFLVFIMIGTSFSFVFFGFSDFNEVVRHNGIRFERFPDRWEARIGGKGAAFSYLPKDVEEIPVNGSIYDLLKGRLEVDSTYDYNSSSAQSIAIAQHQLQLTLRNYGIFVRSGFTTNASELHPVITCEQASSFVPVLYFAEGNETGIEVVNNCIRATASNKMDFIRMKDRMIYELFGVIK